MKKSSKRFLLSSEALNSKGFRVRTAGIRLEEYRKNPQLKWDHDPNRLNIGVAEDITVDGENLYITPAFDDTDEFAMQVANKVENGVIRMASAGLNPIEWRVDENGDLWLWESELIESSMTDKGSNPESYAVALYDPQEELLTLSEDYFKNIKNTMKTITLAASVLGLINLKDGATPDEVTTAIQNLVTLSEGQAKQIVALNANLANANTALKAAQDELVTLKASTEEQQLVLLHDQEIVRNRKTTEDVWVELKTLGYEKAKHLLAKMPANPTVEQQLQQQNLKDDDKALLNLSWDEADKAGKLGEIEKKFPDQFTKINKAKFGEGWKRV